VQDWGRRAEGGLRRGAPAGPPLYDGALPDVDGGCDGDRDASGWGRSSSTRVSTNPLLARDVSSLRDLSGGRFELGLGAGYVKEEFEQAELPFPTAGQRVDHLRHVTEHMGEHVPDVPLLIAGNGDRLLTIAAQRAHIIGLTGGGPATDDADPLADRIAFVRDAAPDRFDDLELNLSIIAMPKDDSGVPDVSIARRFLPGLTDAELLRAPTVLSGSISDMADTLRRYRDVYGVTYIPVQQPHAEAFAKVIAELR
jgi:probable F420-dependent oxidoreductase